MAGVRTLILGIGNPLLSDDGVGVHAVQRLSESALPAGVALAEAGTAGLGILEEVEGYDRLIVLDAIDAGSQPGVVLVLTPADIQVRAPLHLVNPHEADLLTALEVGRRLGLRMPPEILFVAVQIADATTLSETCTPEVAAAIDRVCATALDLARR